MLGRRFWEIVALVGLVVISGCRSGTPTAGSRLPTVPAGSRALPGSVAAADVPGAPTVAESRNADLTTYRDTVHGVSFQYPTVWRPDTAGAYLQTPEFAPVAGKPLLMLAFSPQGNVYASTVLNSLRFSYTAVPNSTVAACARLPASAATDAQGNHTVIYNGVPFSEAQGGDAGMCHQQTATVDTTLHGSVCYVFERDFATVCPYNRTETTPRPLTDREAKALQRHLDAIMQSVQIDGGAGH